MKNREHKKTIFVMMLLLAALFLPACGGGDGGSGAASDGGDGGSGPAGLVTIAVAPDKPSIAMGTNQQFTATGTYADATTQNITSSVTWSSSNTTVATINTAGSATSVAAGTTTITATSGSVSGNTTLTVTDTLTFMEGKLVGKWYRYHAYDDSRMYFIFKADRTGCYFEITSTGSRRDEKNFVYWKLDEQNPVSNYVYNIYRRTSASSTLSTYDDFHYLDDTIWKGGYSNLVMVRSNTTRDCQ